MLKYQQPLVVGITNRLKQVNGWAQLAISWSCLSCPSNPTMYDARVNNTVWDAEVQDVDRNFSMVFREVNWIYNTTTK